MRMIVTAVLGGILAMNATRAIAASPSTSLGWNDYNRIIDTYYHEDNNFPQRHYDNAVVTISGLLGPEWGQPRQSTHRIIPNTGGATVDVAPFWNRVFPNADNSLIPYTVMITYGNDKPQKTASCVTQDKTVFDTWVSVGYGNQVTVSGTLVNADPVAIDLKDCIFVTKASANAPGPLLYAPTSWAQGSILEAIAFCAKQTSQKIMSSDRTKDIDVAEISNICLATQGYHRSIR